MNKAMSTVQVFMSSKPEMRLQNVQSYTDIRRNSDSIRRNALAEPLHIPNINN